MKDNSLFEFPDCLDTTSYLSDDAARHGSMIYRVYGVLVHSGEAMAGHYDAYLFSLDFNTWVKYNDSVVSAVDVAQVRADGFGGGERPRVSAYILLYMYSKTFDTTFCMAPLAILCKYRRLLKPSQIVTIL